MSTSTRGARWRAAGTAALLLLAGGVLGIAADRLWLSPSPAEAMPLTAETMAARLGLDPAEHARLHALLDTLHGEMTAAMAQGPDSLRAATDAAHRRLAASLPARSRPAFHMWMREHNEHMLQRMHSGPMGRGGMRGRGMPGGGTPGDMGAPAGGS